MTASGKPWLRHIASMGLTSRLIFMLAVSVVGYVTSIPFAWLTRGTQGFIASAIALAICLAGGLSSLVVGDLFRGCRQTLVPLLLPMLFRMGLPLGLCLWALYRGGTLANAGLAYYLVGFYLLMLVVDSVLTVSMLHPEETGPRAT